jgi:TonB family protein
MCKAAIIISLVFFFCITAHAQKKDTLLYYMHSYPILAASHEVPVDNKYLANYYRVILPPDISTNKNLFIVYDYYLNGKTKMVGKTSTANPSIILQGPSIEYYPNGHRKSSKNYKDNKLTGDDIEYFPNGKIYIVKNYDEKNKVIINSCNDSTGKVLAENGTGHYIEYDKDFKSIFAEGEIVNGVENGEWRGTVGDSIKYVSIYENGNLKEGTSFDSHGKKYTYAQATIQEPEFKGGMPGFYSFLARNIRYPKYAKESNKQGIVYVTFIVNNNGELSNLKIVRGLGYGLDEEVLRVLSSSPPWKPAVIFGIPEKMFFTMPVSFSLQNN